MADGQLQREQTGTTPLVKILLVAIISQFVRPLGEHLLRNVFLLVELRLTKKFTY